MDEARRRLRLPAVLGILGVALVAAVLWAATALAAGDGTSRESDRDSATPAAEYVQSESEPDRDCPNREGESGAGSDI